MDQWDFKKWRKKLGINQIAAGEMLGLSRGAVQHWESEVRPVPLAVELACRELLRRWKKRPEFGPAAARTGARVAAAVAVTPATRT